HPRPRERRPAVDADPHLLARRVGPGAHAARAGAGLAPQGDVGDRHRALEIHDPTLRVLLGGLGVTLDHHHLLDLDPAVLEHALDLAALALLAALGHDHGVTTCNRLGPLSHHSTSGASDTIFMKRLARSSRATGPKMRVPIGSPSLLMRTAELPSKRM